MLPGVKMSMTGMHSGERYGVVDAMDRAGKKIANNKIPATICAPTFDLVEYLLRHVVAWVSKQSWVSARKSAERGPGSAMAGFGTSR